MTYEECFQTETYRGFMKKELRVVQKHLREHYHTSNPFDTLAKDHLIGINPMSKEFLLINEKKSTRSAREREFISNVVMKCVFQTLQLMEEQAKKRIKNLVQNGNL